MTVKFNQCYTNLTKVTVHSQYAKSQKSNVTMLQPIYGLKSRKYVNYHKLFSCTLKVYWLLH